jgi:type II secretory pathway pseudopilin PulG
MLARARRDESGWTLIASIVTLAIVLTVGGATLSLAWRSIGSSTKERDAARALAAADAGADVAAYRMNRALTFQGTAGLLGFPVDTLRTVGCLGVDVGGTTVISTAGGGCSVSPDEKTGDGSTFHYQLINGVHLGAGLGEVVMRRIVVTGTSNATSRRILVTYKLQVNTSNPLALFKRYRYAVCSTRPPTSDPASGCPDPGT